MSCLCRSAQSATTLAAEQQLLEVYVASEQSGSAADGGNLFLHCLCSLFKLSLPGAQVPDQQLRQPGRLLQVQQILIHNNHHKIINPLPLQESGPSGDH